MVAAMSELSGLNDLCTAKVSYQGDIREDIMRLHGWIEIHHAVIPQVTTLTNTTWGF
jgi:hypothetical protein